jgi:hypothetical protein
MHGHEGYEHQPEGRMDGDFGLEYRGQDGRDDEQRVDDASKPPVAVLPAC